MGSKNRYLTSIFLIVSFVQTGAQTDFRTIDSLTLDYYNNAEWTKLIETGNSAIKSGIDYKHLRQRIGYACFMKMDYLQAKVNFQRAEGFDNYDPFTLEFLYYSNLNTGKADFTGFYEERMSPQLLNYLGIKSFMPVRSIEMEASIKNTSAAKRSGASFYRFGLGTRAARNLTLNQSVSFFSQHFGDADSSFRIQQPDYFLSLSLNVFRNILIRSAWHYTHTISGDNVYPGHLLLTGAGLDLNRLNFDINTSIFKSDYMQNWQTGLNSVYSFFGKSQFYVMASISLINNISDQSKYVVGGGTGMKLVRDSWIELNAVRGDLKGYNDFNGLYVYNTLDPLESRIGFTFRKYSGTHISLWANLSAESYEYYNSNTLHYRQISFLGGLKWKI